MKKLHFLFFGLLLITSALSAQVDDKKEVNPNEKPQAGALMTEEQVQKEYSKKANMETSSFYNITVKDINGVDFSFKKLAGKKVIIVNTASKCGYTPQYAELETLYKKYKENGLVIIGVPSNDFGQQEPGTNVEIATFCSMNYGVTFPMMSKVSVKGKDMCELYKYLTQKSKNGVLDSTVEWNFQKYLINDDGTFEGMITSKEKPMSGKIIEWLNKK
jgi:glutathione peroxidase